MSNDITLGEYILERLKEENIFWKDLDIDTIDFFYQQYKVRNSEGHSEWCDLVHKNVWVSDKKK